VESVGPIVLVGANGCGKTRLGAWIELNSEHSRLTHRVSAQKSLSLPPAVRAHEIGAAERALRHGSEHNRTLDARVGNRWHGNPNVSLLNDYEHLLVYLFSEEAEANARYKREVRATKERVEPPETKLDVAKRIWESVLPARELVIGGGKVEARRKGKPDPYNGSEMSDGERVAFYLIGECLATQPHGTIIIDEPELHLHQSIQSRLWDEIEAVRPDCLFVYLTHNLDFAASRRGATKVWLKDFDGGRWDWAVVPKDDGIPEEMLLALIGSRKPVLFVEGGLGSLDYLVYSRLYPDFTVVPCANGDGVLHATISFAARKGLHALECRGLIDRDHRPNARIDYLAAKNVFATSVSEVESLFLTEAALRAVAAELVIADVDTSVARVKDMVLGEMAKEREKLISARTAAEIEARLLAFDAKAQGEAALSAALTKLTAGIDVTAIYAEATARVDGILAGKDYPEAIKVYNNKGLLSRVGVIFGYKGGFADYLERLVASKKGQAVIEAMRKAAPVIKV
jgi:hypothetical protein